MTADGVRVTPLVLRLALVIVGLAALALIGGSAEAKVYTNATNHYHLTIPDNWNASEASSGVSFEEGIFSSWSISASATPDANAKNNSGYVLTQAQTQCGIVKGAFGGTYQTAPHGITTTSGRVAGECVLDYTLLSTPYRMRVTVFASDYYDLYYVVSANDNATHYPTYQSVWDNAVNGFGVDGEQAPAGGGGGGGGTGTSGGGLLSGTNLYIIIAIVAVAAVGGAMMMRGRKKKGAAQPPSGEQAGAAPPPAKK